MQLDRRPHQRRWSGAVDRNVRLLVSEVRSAVVATVSGCEGDACARALSFLAAVIFCDVAIWRRNESSVISSCSGVLLIGVMYICGSGSLVPATDAGSLPLLLIIMKLVCVVPAVN